MSDKLSEQELLQILHNDFEALRVRWKNLNKSPAYIQECLRLTDVQEVLSIMEVKKKGFFKIGH